MFLYLRRIIVISCVIILAVMIYQQYELRNSRCPEGQLKVMLLDGEVGCAVGTKATYD